MPKKLVTVLAAVLALATLSVVPAVAQAAEPPTVVTDAASAVTQTSATLNAEVNPNGEGVIDCHFEFGTTISYGSSASCAHLPGSGNSLVGVSASVTGLIGGNTYHFRIVARNARGTSVGNDRTFTTLGPYYYQNRSLIPEGEQLPTLEWGQLTVEAEPPNGSPITCETAAGGFVENPVGGGAGRGQTTTFTFWNCSNAECPEGDVEIKGQKYEKQFEIIAPPQDLPWPSELTEKEAGKIRTNGTGVVVELECTANPSTRGTAPAAGQNEPEPLVAPTACEATATHLWEPEDENGANKGPGQSKLIFNQRYGSGLFCADGVVTGHISESLKVMGYEGSELITVK